MTQKELLSLVINKAEEFGLVRYTKSNPSGNAVVRDYSLSGPSEDKAYWFGFINPGEPDNGSYQDISFAIFPGNKEEMEGCVVGLSVGSQGFYQDLDLASRPGTRRMFLKLRNDDNKHNIFFKTSFTDNQSSMTPLVKTVKSSYPSLIKAIDCYHRTMLAAEIIDFSHDGFLTKIYSWLALFAQMRQWGSKSVHGKARKDWLDSHLPAQLAPCVEDDIKMLLQAHKYLVLQGAPGVGKTHHATKIAKGYDKVFFTQFHAETSYSDFIGGLMPHSKGGFYYHRGEFTKAVEHAVNNPDENVLLIIDEINRANLPNVLGPVFYLFEKNHDARQHITMKVGNAEISSLPSNLHVIATMNTADRNLAVVDFALRRRFVWYTIKPRPFTGPGMRSVFRAKEFNEFSQIFETYATDAELPLQPGPSYFLADDDNIMRQRLIYELMPLVKEYLTEGYLTAAADDFSHFFYSHTGKLLFE